MAYFSHWTRWLLIAGLLLASPLRADDNPRVGRKLSDFQLKDYRGKQHQLSDFEDSQLLVLAFLGTECPLAKLYAPRLASMADKYEDQGVAFVGVNANTQDSITEIAAYARKHELEFPILKDLGNRVADQIGAVRTPEVFVIDKKRVVRYWGRIDDQYGVGYVRDNPKREDLKVALDELLAGKQVSNPKTESAGCYIGRVRKAESSDVTFSNQISRILQNRCVSCHRDGEIAPFALTDYDEVAGWAETIEEVVRDRRMPPWHADPKYGHFKNDCSLTEEEKQLIYRWVAAGAPEGDPSQLPEPREFVSGWSLPKEPDDVFYIRERPVRVPAQGTVRYQYYQVDSGFEEDKWIKALEVRPGNTAVVHHILVFAAVPGGNLDGVEGGVSGFLAGYVPGLRADPFPPGMAKRVRAGSTLVFQVHYTPIGTVQEDRSMVGFVYADPKEVTHEVKTTSSAQRRLRIPPNDGNHRVGGRARSITEDALLLSYMPHMHLRGKSFRYEARFADGSSEILLNVPRYDFNWQTSYRLVEPLKLAAGTRIVGEAHFDNSDANLSNPDPERTVRWGDQTWEEMMIGYFDIAVPVDATQVDPPPAGGRRGEAFRRRLVEGMFQRLDENDDGKLVKDELPERWRRAFAQADANSDGSLSLEELMKVLPQRGSGG